MRVKVGDSRGSSSSLDEVPSAVGGQSAASGQKQRVEVSMAMGAAHAEVAVERPDSAVLATPHDS